MFAALLLVARDAANVKIMFQVQSTGGKFIFRIYEETQYGMEAHLDFFQAFPGTVGLIQVLKPSVDPRKDAHQASGWYVDAGHKSSPVFGLNAPIDDYKIENSRARNDGNMGAFGKLGTSSFDRAEIRDKPQRQKHKTFTMDFEVAAMYLTGEHRGKSLIAVDWGFAVNEGVVTTKNPVVHAAPSKNWYDAAKEWNKYELVKIPLVGPV